jgi:hypothetical protein
VPRRPVRQHPGYPSGKRQPGPLPGSTAESFFDAWLEHGTGGTCWSGNGALHDLLGALGFDVERVIATMLSSPQATEPNHGSVMATVDGERWLVDASILSGAPLRIPGPGETADEGPLPRFAWLDDRPAVLWTAEAPEGFTAGSADRRRCGGVGRATPADGRLEPVQHQLSARLLQGKASVGVARGQFRVEPDSSVSVEDLDPRAGFASSSRSSASQSRLLRVPDDRPVPPRPD